MSYYRSKNYWGPQTNEMVKNNEEKVIGGHWRPKEYYPRCNCQSAEYGQLGETVDSLKGMSAASELNGLNSTNINAIGFEPFIGSEEYVIEGFTENPIMFWGSIIFAIIALVGIIFLIYWLVTRRRTITAKITKKIHIPKVNIPKIKIPKLPKAKIPAIAGFAPAVAPAPTVAPEIQIPAQEIQIPSEI